MRPKTIEEKAKDLGVTYAPRAYPIPKARLAIPTFWSLKGRQVWAPLRFEHGGIFYGERRFLDSLLNRFCSFPQKESQYMEIVYASYAEMKTVLKKRYFTALTLEADLESVLDEFLLIKAGLQELSAKNPERDLNRKVSLVFLELGPRELSELKRPEVEEKFLRLLKNAGDLRLHFFLVAQKAFMVPKSIRSNLPWKAYLGEDNYTFADEAYEDLPLEPYNINRELSGMLIDSSLNLRLPVHDIAFEHSGFKKATDLVAKMEEDAFKKLLDSI